MGLKNKSINLKIFLIEKNHIDFKGKDSQGIIDVIKNNHINKLRALYDDITDVNATLEHANEDDFELWSYCYNHPKENYYWKSFLPDMLGETQNFKVIEFSYVLFLKYKTDIYCVIGGSGMSVIKKYIDSNFGIDLYQYFAKPNEDVLIDLTMRSIAGSVSQKKNTYTQNQTLIDSINYSEIPHKIKLVIRDEIKKTLFKKYSLSERRSILEIGSYFSIKKKLSYKLLKELIRDIDKIKSDDSNYQELTLFKKVKDPVILNELDQELIKLIADDVLSLNSPNGRLGSSDVIEIVHPSKLEKFYECNNFNIKLKSLRDGKSVTVYDRKNLYSEVVRYIYSMCENTLSREEIKTKIFKTNIKGNHDDENLTFANFISHVTAEMPLNGKKYFRIDAYWYYLADKFIEQIKKEATEYYRMNKFEVNLLKPWKVTDDEDKYNLSHEAIKDYYILDKKIKENIELCDILVLKDNKLYFIHVKDGFDANMRDLYVQVILSAKRLWNDIKNNEGVSYLKNTLEYYNAKKKKYKIKTSDIIKKLEKGELGIVFVMAYNNRAYKTKTSLDKIGISKSNIAKYSLVQANREMKEFSTFEFKIIDISELKL